MRRDGWVGTSITPTGGEGKNSLVSISGDGICICLFTYGCRQTVG